MNRRSFLTAILASACAPAIVRAASLMPVRELSEWQQLSGFGLAQLKAEGSVIPFDQFGFEGWDAWVSDDGSNWRALALAMRETKEKAALKVLVARPSTTLLIPPGQQAEWDRIITIIDDEPLASG